jgi:hypothetical protein
MFFFTSVLSLRKCSESEEVFWVWGSVLKCSGSEWLSYFFLHIHGPLMVHGPLRFVFTKCSESEEVFWVALILFLTYTWTTKVCFTKCSESEEVFWICLCRSVLTLRKCSEVFWVWVALILFLEYPYPWTAKCLFLFYEVFWVFQTNGPWTTKVFYKVFWDIQGLSGSHAFLAPYTQQTQTWTYCSHMIFIKLDPTPLVSLFFMRINFKNFKIFFLKIEKIKNSKKCHEKNFIPKTYDFCSLKFFRVTAADFMRINFENFKIFLIITRVKI